MGKIGFFKGVLGVVFLVKLLFWLNNGVFRQSNAQVWGKKRGKMTKNIPKKTRKDKKVELSIVSNM